MRRARIHPTWHVGKRGRVARSGRSLLALATVGLLVVAASPARSATASLTSAKKAPTKKTANNTKTAKKTKTKTTKAPTTTVDPGPPTGLDWVDCGDGLQCSYFTVPIDRANPALGTTKIAVSRRPATNSSQRIGVLFMNPGGPGGSGTDLVRGFTLDAIPGLNGGYLDRFDLVGFDPRGVGRSDPIRCSSKLSDIGLNPFTKAKTPEERAEVTKRWAASCAERTGPLFSHAGTIEAADDMDDLRVALRETQISYLGFSYGSVLGSVYAARHGAQLRASVLDAAVDPTTYGTTYLTDKAVAIEARVHAFSSQCFGQPSCALATGANSATDVETKISDTFSKVSASGPEGAARAGLVRSTTAVLLEETKNWKQAAILFARLGGSEGADLLDGIPPISPLAELTDDPAFWTVQCHDGAYPNTPEQLAATRAAIASSAPITGGVFEGRDSVCVNWPGGVAPLSLVSTAAVTTLVIGGTNDSRTPAVWSSGLVKAMGNASLLLRDGDGHTSYDRSLCVRRSIGQYLANLTLPPAGTICASSN
jgi:pimeloyl-ACP methyl ester carboxylesterase